MDMTIRVTIIKVAMNGGGNRDDMSMHRNVSEGFLAKTANDRQGDHHMKPILATYDGEHHSGAPTLFDAVVSRVNNKRCYPISLDLAVTAAAGAKVHPMPITHTATVLSLQCMTRMPPRDDRAEVHVWLVATALLVVTLHPDDNPVTIANLVVTLRHRGSHEEATFRLVAMLHHNVAKMVAAVMAPAAALRM